MTSMAKKKADLHLYVFGASVGESIVIRLPDRSWAVIDCYATSPSDPLTSPAHRLLSSRGVETLEFLCLTHPHADHFMGMSRLVSDFTIKHFWGFGGLHPPDFDLLKTFFQADAATSGLPDAQHRASEIASLFDQIRVREIPHQAVAAKTLVYPASIDSKTGIRIWGLAPSGRHTNDYRRSLLKSTKGKQFKSALPKSDHNLISSAFLIEFGWTRIILGGDVEVDGWQDVLTNQPVSDLAAHAVKVPHHGSRNGYCPGLWDRFSAGRKPVAILTPYASKSLPQQDALDHIHPQAKAIHSAAALRHDPNSFPTSSNPRLARIRTMLVTKAKARRLGSSGVGGFCHVVFDDQGRYRLRHQGDAGRIA
jgi:beta-lactamase superfamily II metal-dependent hydrolase